MTNNELSRKMIEFLSSSRGKLRFKQLVEHTGEDPRAVFKNLFFLEERGFVQLSTSYPSDDSVYPLIHLIRLRRAGEDLLKNAEAMDRTFPLTDQTTDTSIHIPPDPSGGAPLTFKRALELLAARVRETAEGEEKDWMLEKIESLLGLAVVDEPVAGKK